MTIPIPPSPWVPTATHSETKLFPQPTMDAFYGIIDEQTAPAVAAAEAAAAAAEAALDALPEHFDTEDEAIAGLILSPPSETRAALSATFAPRGAAKRSDGVLAAVHAGMEAGRCVAMQVQGDSTGNASDEWVFLLTQWLASEHPSAHVKYKVWDDTAQEYAAWSTVQAAAGERHAVFLNDGTTRTMYTPKSAIPTPTGDLDVRVRLSMDDWTPGVGACIVARYGGSGFRSWMLNINTAGRIDFSWSENGTDPATFQKVAGTATGFADGSTGWVRVTVDVDNGAGGFTWKAYTSTDGVTWTEVGSSVDTISGATNFFDADQEYEIGGRGFVGAMWAGKVYEVQIRDGINGPIINPQPIDSWTPRAPSGGYVGGYFGGSPTLYVLNGSHPGAALTYLNNATRHPKMVHPYFGSVLFQSCSHNDAANIGAQYIADRTDWAEQSLTRAPGSQIVTLTQNPQLSGSSTSNDTINNHGRRRLLLIAWAARHGFALIDTFGAILDDPRGAAALTLSDGVHPNTDGSIVWAETVAAAFTAA